MRRLLLNPRHRWYWLGCKNIGKRQKSWIYFEGKSLDLLIGEIWDMRSRNDYKILGLKVDIVKEGETARVAVLGRRQGDQFWISHSEISNGHDQNLGLFTNIFLQNCTSLHPFTWFGQVKKAHELPLSYLVRSFKSQNWISVIPLPSQDDQKNWATIQCILHT